MTKCEAFLIRLIASTVLPSNLGEFSDKNLLQARAPFCPLNKPNICLVIYLSGTPPAIASSI